MPLLDDGVNDGAEDGVDVAVEDGVDVAVEDGVDVAVEDGVDVAVEDGVDVAVEDGVDVAVEDGVDVAVEDGVDVAVEDGVDVAVEDGVDVAVEDGVDVAVEDGVDVAVEDGVDVAVEDGVDVAVEDGVDVAVEDGVDVAVEDGVDVAVEDGVDVAVEDGVDVAVEDGVDVAVEDGVDVAVEDGVDVAVEDGVDVAVEDGVDVAVEDGVDVAVEDGVDVAVEDGVDVAVEDGRDVPWRTAVDVAVEDGVTVVVAGDTLWSNSPLGAPTSGSNVLGDAAFGNGSAYVVSMWWQGPTARVSAFGLFSMGSSEVEVITASSCWSSLACLLVGVDQRNSRAHVAARVNGSAIKSPGTVLSAFGHAASSLRLEKSYLRSWHHVVMAVLPHNLDAGSMRVWIDGVTLEQTCTRRTGLGFVETPLGLSEPFLPSAAREGCNFAMAITEPPLKADNISRLPPSFSDGRLVWGTRASLSPTGRVTRSGSGGSASTLGFYLSDRPFTLANRLVLAHTAPAAALADAMPTWAPGVLFACRLADTSNFALAGRTVCQATCADPGDVLAVDLHAALCGTPSDPASRAAQWLQGSVDDAAGLCKLADTAAGQDALQRGVWAAGDGVASWLALPVSWASPIGWAGVIGAAGRTDDLPWTREGLERWAQFAPWKDAGLGRPAHRGRSGLPVARPAAVRPLPGSGWPDAFGFRHGQSAGPPTGQSLACRPAPTEVSLRRAVPQSMVVQACLGGLSLDPAFRHAESALSDRLALDHLLLQLHQDVVTLAGLNNATGSRAIISREGIVTAEHALQVRETVVGFDPSLTADALCKSPSRDALIGAYGQGVTSSCLCTHIGIAAAPVHPEAASSSSRRDAAGTAPWAEAGSPAMSTAAFAAAALASSLRFAPTLSTPLTVLAAVSPASVTVFPVYTCGSETRREAGERAAGADPSIVLLLRSITDGLVSGWAPPFPTGAPFHAASAPSLVVCGDLKQETLMWLTLPVAAAVAAYVALSLSYSWA
ncbi:hypothetical protein FNF28_02735 [Cafeteria roenbergensis]|uniref:Uncharacterized protein n=1 Tax=Cafeteria roenbergensis TaxID=33653 RepID=A0A5A8DSQ4_CAFRO|nr:hypothetical protein FNF28_02735 [Cafeteria roenbergensis]